MNDIYNYDLIVDTSSQYNLDINGSNDIELTANDNVIIITRETFIYHQRVASAIWEIQHNMDRYPSVTIVDSAGSKVVGEVQYIDRNNLIVSFSAGFAGTAYLN